MKASNFKLSICPSENYFSGAHRNQRTFAFGGGKYHYIDGLQFHKHASLHTNNNMKNGNFAMDTDNSVAPPIPLVYWFCLQNLRHHMCCIAIKTKLLGVVGSA